MPGSEDDSFLLYHPGVIPRLQERGFFRDAIAQFYTLTAELHGCRITLSERRLGDAHDFWLGDVERALVSGTDDETTELDHFKNAAFIAFWLRRLVPINEINFDESQRIAVACASTAPSPKQIRFYQYGNEFCALMAGFYICLAYEVYAMEKRRSSTVKIISDAAGVRKIPAQFLSEYPKLLKHKNFSPHALYMLFRSLFDSLDWDVRTRTPRAA